MNLNGGYIIINKDDENVYNKAFEALTLGKPILWYEDNTTCYFIDTISLSGTDIILTKGGLTITIESDGDITETGNIQPTSQVQSDWSQSDNTKVDYIKNKPTIPTATKIYRHLIQINHMPTSTTAIVEIYSTNNNQINTYDKFKTLVQTYGKLGCLGTSTGSHTRIPVRFSIVSNTLKLYNFGGVDSYGNVDTSEDTITDTDFLINDTIIEV